MTAVVLTTVLSTNIMDSIQARLDLTWSVVLDVGVVLAGALAAIQIFLRYDGRSDSHRVAAREWNEIHVEITETLLLLVEGKAQLRGDPKSYLDQLRDRMDTVSRDSPPIGDTNWTKAVRTLSY